MAAVRSEAPPATEREAGPDQLFERVQALQDRLESSGADPSVLELAGELVSAVVAMYGEGLERIFATEEGRRIGAALSEDPVIATLLLIHDLHPVPLEQRVQDALDTVRPYMESHGGSVELLEVHDGVARIHLRGSCSDCAASSVTLELAVKRALEEHAPDLAELVVEGMAPQMSGLALPMADGDLAAGNEAAGSPPPGENGVELPMVMAGPGAGASSATPTAPAPTWVELDALAGLEPGTMTGVDAAGDVLLVANVEGTLLAYRDRCTACGSSFREGELTEGALACPSCRRSFFLPRAGRSLDDEGLQLEPVPLLREHGHVKVALAGR